MFYNPAFYPKAVGYNLTRQVFWLSALPFSTPSLGKQSEVVERRIRIRLQRRDRNGFSPFSLLSKLTRCRLGT